MALVRPARPPFDPELAPVVEAVGAVDLTAATLPQIRGFAATPPDTVAAVLAGRGAERRDVGTTAPDGGPVALTVLRPARRAPGVLAPAVLWLHGGGMVMGDRFSQIDVPLDWLERFGAVVVTVDYRLAPEHPAPAGVEDGYRALCWLAEHAGELGVDPARLVVAGVSAGGGVAAGVTLLARDRGGPRVAAQVLSCPMLDHRDDTTSSHQYAGGPATWTREQNAFGWAALLGEGHEGGRDGVLPYASPAVAEDLSGLPPTFVDVGSAEVFRDEDVRYASRIWAAGGDAELHVWPGGFHGFDVAVPAARLSVAARSARTAWLARALGVA
ncbi:alpha/beta hydrolase [Promicromonospora thailandica]|uniref:Acetyl esterase/lipase n=1 Tax=Promicromonospora thailandica TaxID=765201 RepID=A0A9X2G7B7_9MICO|nr:alpha/beta hydrolase [Promicromonospora thailandica]MCP2266960.1 Acetyl esterase/lipase [Promicromonospora thailandica]